MQICKVERRDFYMGRKSKYSSEVKLEIIEAYLNGEKSALQLAFEYDIARCVIYVWINKYKKYGIDIFKDMKRNSRYTKEFKHMVVQEYIEGVDSSEGLALKHGIPALSTVLNWVEDYNNHIELKDYDPKGEVYMVDRRKTSLEERVEIVEYCLKHNREFKNAAEVYQVSYSQVYQWVKKYELEGQEGLLDRRGKPKSQESLSEVEKLQKKIDQLEKQLELKENENTLLKKVKEFERRRYSVKLDKKRNI